MAWGDNGRLGENDRHLPGLDSPWDGLCGTSLTRGLHPLTLIYRPLQPWQVLIIIVACRCAQIFDWLCVSFQGSPWCLCDSCHSYYVCISLFVAPLLWEALWWQLWTSWIFCVHLYFLWKLWKMDIIKFYSFPLSKLCSLDDKIPWVLRNSLVFQNAVSK